MLVTKKGQLLTDLRIKMAERVGFEPTCLLSQTTRFRVERVTAGLRYLSAEGNKPYKLGRVLTRGSPCRQNSVSRQGLGRSATPYPPGQCPLQSHRTPFALLSPVIAHPRPLASIRNTGPPHRPCHATVTGNGLVRPVRWQCGCRRPARVPLLAHKYPNSISEK